MKAYDLYGLIHDDLEAGRKAVEQALGIELKAHESSYVGDYYRVDTTSEESLELRRNLDPIDGEPAEQAFPAVGLLLYVNGTERSEEIEQALAVKAEGFILLRREILD